MWGWEGGGVFECVSTACVCVCVWGGGVERDKVNVCVCGSLWLCVSVCVKS